MLHFREGLGAHGTPDPREDLKTGSLGLAGGGGVPIASLIRSLNPKP